MRAFPVLLSTMLASAIAAAEPPAWPQFRGPAESGVAPDSEKPPTQIGPSKNLKWKVAVPAGFSSPVVAGHTPSAARPLGLHPDEKLKLRSRPSIRH